MSIDHEVQEHVDRAHLPGRLDYFPFEIDVVWIEQAKRTLVVLVFHLRKHFFEQNLVAVPVVDVDLFPWPGEFTELRGAFRVRVDEVILREWRLSVQRDQRATLDDGFRRLGHMDARPGIGVDVMPAKAGYLFASILVENCDVRGCVLLYDGQFDFRPYTDLVVLCGHSRNCIKHLRSICEP